MGGSRRKKPVTIRGPGFAQRRGLEVDDLETLRSDTKEDAFDDLIEDWNNKIMAFAVVDISQVNFSPTGAEVQLKGPIFDSPRGKSFKSSKYFNLSDRYTLVFGELDCSCFTFVNSMISNHVDSSQLDFEFKKDLAGPAVSDEDLRTAGFVGFTLRAYLNPTTATYAKLTILLFPLNMEQLLSQNPLAVSPYFPGISFAAPEIPFLPHFNDLLDGEPCGLPFLPALISEAPFNEDDRPATAELIGSMAALLRTVAVPEAKAGISQTAARWEEIRLQGEPALKQSQAELLSPDQDQAPPPPGGRLRPLISFGY